METTLEHPQSPSRMALDPFSVLPVEISARILTLVDTASLPTISRVSKRWHTLNEDPSVWRIRILKPSLVHKRTTSDGHGEIGEDGSYLKAFSRFYPPPDGIIPTTDVQESNTGEDISRSRKAGHRIRFLDFVVEPKQVFIELGKIACMGLNQKMPLLDSGIAASSEDDPTLQSIESTLDQNAQSFWSSKGSATPGSSEWLTYKLVQPICVVESLSIVPYKATYQRGMPIYAPREIEIRVGFTPDPEQMHYRSRVFPVQNQNVEQWFPLSPHLVVGGYLHLKMVGRYQTQPGDNLWYTVLQTVHCVGKPCGLIALSHLNLTQSLLGFCEALKCDYEPWYGQRYDSGSISSQQRNIRHRELAEEMALEMEPEVTKIEQVMESMDLIRTLVRASRWTDAMRLVADSSPDTGLREPEFLEWFFESAAEGPGSVTQRLLYYFGRVAAGDSDLNEYEARTFARVTAQSGNLQTFWRCIVDDRIQCSEALGDIFFDHHVQLALQIYSRANVVDKVVDCFVHMEEYRAAIRLAILNTNEAAEIVRDLVNRTEPRDAAVELAVVAIDVDAALLREPVLAGLGVTNQAEHVPVAELPGWLRSWADAANEQETI
ncbi:hypothetical protein DFJ77DRAFT_452188 [Powellomyces hirtus]|nr:hypothetical protein DFJ77DRAFT_452188 [Powellomyces hirtus]